MRSVTLSLAALTWGSTSGSPSPAKRTLLSSCGPLCQASRSCASHWLRSGLAQQRPTTAAHAFGHAVAGGLDLGIDERIAIASKAHIDQHLRAFVPGEPLLGQALATPTQRQYHL